LFRATCRELRAAGAQLFFVLTNDEWFAGSEAPWQHAAMSAVRAVENNVWVAQSANGGYSFAVDPKGRFVVKSNFNVPQTLDMQIPLRVFLKISFAIRSLSNLNIGKLSERSLRFCV
jgi:apolipoprotein N-acyltransferase